MSPRGNALAVALAVAFVCGGCGLLFGAVGRPGDDFSDWSRLPLPPDPALNAEAQQTCGGEPGRPRLPLLFQDRRTAESAIVVFGNADEYAMCSVSHGGGGRFGAGVAEIGGNPPAAFSISASRTQLGNSQLTLVDGRVGPAAAGVRVLRDDGVIVEASVGGGRWLAWWPTDSDPVRAVAYDSSGAEIARAEAPETHEP